MDATRENDREPVCTSRSGLTNKPVRAPRLRAITEGMLVPAKWCNPGAIIPAASEVAIAWVFPSGMKIIVIEIKLLGLPDWQPLIEEEIN